MDNEKKMYFSTVLSFFKRRNEYECEINFWENSKFDMKNPLLMEGDGIVWYNMYVR